MTFLAGSKFKQITGQSAKPLLRPFGRQFPGNKGYNPSRNTLQADYAKLQAKLEEAVKTGNFAKQQELGLKLIQVEQLLGIYNPLNAQPHTYESNTYNANTTVWPSTMPDSYANTEKEAVPNWGGSNLRKVKRSRTQRTRKHRRACRKTRRMY